MKAKRLAFAKQYEDWNEARWRDVPFLDESTIQQLVEKKQTVCKLVGTQFNDRYTPAMVKHPPSVVI